MPAMSWHLCIDHDSYFLDHMCHATYVLAYKPQASYDLAAAECRESTVPAIQLSICIFVTAAPSTLRTGDIRTFSTVL